VAAFCVLQLKSRDVLSLPKRYGKLPDRTRERLRRDSLVISTTSAKPEQVLDLFLFPLKKCRRL
jgi:hypothetical protein